MVVIQSLSFCFGFLRYWGEKMVRKDKGSCGFWNRYGGSCKDVNYKLVLQAGLQLIDKWNPKQGSF